MSLWDIQDVSKGDTAKLFKGIIIVLDDLAMGVAVLAVIA